MILVLGAKGQVGSALLRLLGPDGTGFDRAEMDLAAAPEMMIKQLDMLSPDCIINAAAYTQVDKAESEPELAEAINARAPAVIAAWCARRNTPFVHYSTDYVFNDSSNAPRDENAPTGPFNIYGKTKLAGERAVMAAGGRFLIFRTSWVYDEAGKNFLNTMLRLGTEREELSVVNDQFGAPTYATHLAEATLKALKKDFTPGIYHLCNAGETTWYGFAEAIFAEARKAGQSLRVQKVKSMDSAYWNAPAKRPMNSRLSCEKAKQQLGIVMPAWQDGLHQCMKNKYANQTHAA